MKSSAVQLYTKVLIVLLFLTVLTVLVAKPVSGIDLGLFSGLIAFAIATLKATFVAAIFMHLKEDNQLNRFIFFSGFFFLFIMFIFIYFDIITRVTETSPL